MPRETFKYSNNDITVIWKPNACIHSTLCWNGLKEVFNPREHPWIKMDAAITDKIISQVSQCPSGALSYFMNDLSAIEPVVAPQAGINPTLQVAANGPYIIQSGCTIIYSDGREEVREGKVALCRCGGSGSKPFCDGTHKKNDFKG